MSDRYTYCVSDESSTAHVEACITSNHPLTPAEVDSYISVSADSYYDDTYVPVDQPWYWDWFDGALNGFDNSVRWVTERSIIEIIIMVATLAVIIALVTFARSSDLADDSYEAEDYIEELNDDASDRAYSLSVGTYEEEEEEA